MARDDQQRYEMHALSGLTDQGTHSNTDRTQETVTTPMSSKSSITVRDPATTSLHATIWAVVIFIAYAFLSLFAWVMLCIMNKRPILKEKSYHSHRVGFDVAGTYLKNERYFIAAQVLQSVTTLLTIPMTTAICSMACVAYMQAGSLRKSLTLKQTMALADRGWISPHILLKINTLGSLPLYFALALTLVGSIGQILQNTFVKQESILASGFDESGYLHVNDVPGLLEGEIGFGEDGDSISRLRELMQSPYTSGDDSNRWEDVGLMGLNPDYIPYGMSEAPSLLYVPLRSDFTAGAYPFAQYAPRINSSISYVNITESEFKKNCRNETDNGGFYARYERYAEYQNVTLEACMPVDLRQSPWNKTRDRQDIYEELYFSVMPFRLESSESTYWKASAKTSLGYFEVPSESNGNTPGALLDKDPLEHDKHQHTGYFKRAENVSYTGQYTISQGLNRGPLASVALALFGRFSFVESRFSDASRFVLPPDDVNRFGDGVGSYVCVYRYPLSNWLGSDSCITHRASLDESDVYGQAGEFLDLLRSAHGSRRDVLLGLNNALFMANKIWLSGNGANVPYDSQIAVYHDQGIRTTKPKISQAGVVVGSVFLGAHLLGLLALAIYVLFMKPWSRTMGAEVMLKMGMAYSDVLATLETKKQWDETVSQLPGFIGDGKPGEEIGELRLGALAGLGRKEGRKFEILR